MIKFEKHIPLSIGSGNGLYTIQTTSASYVLPDYPSYVQIDVSKYSDASYYYEVSLNTSAGTGYATLYNDTAAAAVSGGEVSTSSTSIVRVRSSALTLTGSDTYTDKIKNNGTNNTATYSHKLVIVQSAEAISKTETQITLFAYTTSTTTSASYVQPASIGDAYFLYTSANWDGTFAAYYEATLKTSAATAYSQLYVVGGSGVSNGEVTTTSTSFVRVRSSAVTLSNASAYKAMIKNDGSNTTSFNSGRLIIQQSGYPTKTEAILPLAVNSFAASATGGSYADSQGRFYYDPANVSVDSATWYAEVTALWGGVVGNGVRVYDIDAAGALSGSTMAPPGASTTRVRSSAVTVPGAAHTLRAECDSGAGTHYVSSPKLIGVLTWTNVIRTGASFLLANIDDL